MLDAAPVPLGNSRRSRTGFQGVRFIGEHSAENVYIGVAARRDASSGELANCHHLAAQCPVACRLQDRSHLSVVKSGGFATR